MVNISTDNFNLVYFCNDNDEVEFSCWGNGAILGAKTVKFPDNYSDDRDISFTNITCENETIVGFDLPFSEFRGAIFRHTKLKEFKIGAIKSGNFQFCDFHNGEIGEIWNSFDQYSGVDITFSECTFKNVKFGDIRHAHFDNCNFIDCSFEQFDALAVQCNFLACDCSRMQVWQSGYFADFEQCCVHDCKGLTASGTYSFSIANVDITIIKNDYCEISIITIVEMGMGNRTSFSIEKECESGPLAEDIVNFLLDTVANDEDEDEVNDTLNFVESLLTKALAMLQNA